MQQFVLTAVGHDRPGLVDQVSGFLLQQGANIADARMINLQGQFAMIILAAAAAQVVDDLRHKAATVGASAGLNISITEAGPPDAVRLTGLPMRLRTYAMDQPGIVHKVTALLARHHVNIEELQTHLTSASVSGSPLFSMEMFLTLPAELPVKVLRGELEELCAALNCDMDLTAAD
jgi:glycine cleavage system transcriptional repressor